MFTAEERKKHLKPNKKMLAPQQKAKNLIKIKMEFLLIVDIFIMTIFQGSILWNTRCAQQTR